MKQFVLALPLLFFLNSSAFAITAQEEKLIVNNVKAVLGRAELNLPDTLPVHRLCGTTILMEAKERWGELSPQARAALAPLLSPRPALQTSYAPPSGRFRIHYDLTGPVAVRDAGIRNAQNIPVWVDTLGMILDSIWDREVTRLGFRPPVRDDFYAAGGDSLFDIYLDALSGGILGYTAPDSAAGVLGNRATAFMVLDNDYAGISGYTDPDGPRRAIRVTAAHEFFHAIQFAYTVNNVEAPGPYWYEATAVWMEDQVYNEINDYIQYLPSWFRKPELSFRTFSSDLNDIDRLLHPYALGIYGHYLSKKFPSYPGIRRVWESMATVSGFNLFQAIDSVLGFAGFMPGASYPQRFLASLQEFYHWNYFVGRNRPLNVNFYAPEDSFWPTFDSYHKVDSTANYPTRFPRITISCTQCLPDYAKFFCAPCSTNTIGSPCSTKCPPTCRFIPYELSRSAICVNYIEDLGTTYLNLQNPGRAGSFMDFALVSDTANPAPFSVSLARYSIGPPRSYGFLTEAATDSFGRIRELFLPGLRNYSEVVATVMNGELLPPGAARQYSTYAYFANVDSSVPPSFTELVEGRPNPFRPGIDQKVSFPVALDSLSGVWKINLIVYSSAGEVVYRETLELPGSFSSKEAVFWEGKNESGRPVASGVYFCKIIMEEKGASRKLEKLAKVALIRQ